MQMPLPQIDLSACAREPIHTPGQIQPHGVLLAVGLDGRISQTSANTDRGFGLSPEEVLDTPLTDLLGGEAAALVTGWMDRLVEGESALHPCPALGPLGHPGWLGGHRWQGRLLLEVEFCEQETLPARHAGLSAELAAFTGETNLFKLCQRAAELVQQVLGYDRVMIYRFHADWTGEVVAEARSDTAIPYLGLRYPASDIPEQARRLYLQARVRAVPDVAAIPSALVPRNDPATGRPLDIGITQLRALSPVHIEYLQNMGVGASLTASIAIDGRLWGLIACHHDRRRPAPPPMRADLTAIAGRLAHSIDQQDRMAADRAADRAERRTNRLVAHIADSHNLARALLFGPAGLRTVMRADGWALVSGHSLAATGSTPSAERMRQIARALAERHGPGLWRSDALERDLPLPPDMEAETSSAGLLANVLALDPPTALLCFANELVHEVKWGGDPSKPAVIDPVTHRLSPRKSFELWRQTVRGTSRPWLPEDVALVRCVGERLGGLWPANDLPLAIADGIVGLSVQERSREELSEEFLDALDEGIVCLMDLKAGGASRVHKLNRRFRDTFGLMPDDLEDISVADLLDRCGLPAELAELTGESHRDCEGWNPNSGRRTFRVARHVVVDLQSDSEHAGIAMLTFNDITEYRQTEEALRAARDRALEAERTKASFLAGVSHELRTPLNAIIGFSEMLAAEVFGPLGSARYRGYAEDIRNAGQHLLALVNDILEAARLGSGQSVLNESRFDLGQELAQACGLLSGQARAAGLTYGWEFAETPVMVRADSRAIRQIVLNLLSNALKYTPEGGAVTCRLGREPDGETWFEVEDTGVGMSEADQDNLFKPFQRVGQQTAAGVQGTGLGLALVKAISDLHGGRIAVDSRYGHGTRVRVTLPGWRAG